MEADGSDQQPHAGSIWNAAAGEVAAMGRSLRISTVGVRGIVGPGLKAHHALEFAAAFSVLLSRPDPVMIARDPRASSVMLREGIVASLLASGRDVIDLGLASTPVLQHAIQRTNAAGGISIGASHNNAEWNALKFLGPNGTYLSNGEASELLDIYHLRKFEFKDWTQVGVLHHDDEAMERYIEDLERVFQVKALEGLKIVADCSSGLSSLILKRLKDRHPLDITMINATLESKAFAHTPNTNARTVGLQLAPVVQAMGGDLGVLFDMDSDRIAVCCGDGEVVSEEMILPLLAEYQLKRQPGRMIITNLSTTSLVDDVAARYGASVLRLPVGRQHAMDALSMYPAEKIAIAGEGTGAVMLPEFRFVYDGIASLLALVSHLKHEKCSLKKLLAGLPRYDMRKVEVALDAKRIPEMMTELEDEWAGAKLDTQDGLRVDFENGWFHVRVSNTEPVVRVIAEMRQGSADELISKLLDTVRSYA
jgi:phosphomannomutase